MPQSISRIATTQPAPGARSADSTLSRSTRTRQHFCLPSTGNFTSLRPSSRSGPTSCLDSLRTSQEDQDPSALALTQLRGRQLLFSSLQDWTTSVRFLRLRLFSLAHVSQLLVSPSLSSPVDHRTNPDLQHQHQLPAMSRKSLGLIHLPTSCQLQE